MSAREATYVFCYDVQRPKTRRRISGLLEEVIVRVQDSVFEGRLTRPQADRLFDAICKRLDEGDKLRMYALHADGLQNSRWWGGAPVVESQDFYLL